MIWPLQLFAVDVRDSRSALRYINPPQAIRASHAALKRYKIVGWYDVIIKADDRTIPTAYQMASFMVIAFDSLTVK